MSIKRILWSFQKNSNWQAYWRVIHFKILHCTLMFVNVTSLPQVLFAKHWYCPPSALVILVMFSHLSSLTTPTPIFDHATNGSGDPIALQFKDTLSPSMTVLLSNWFTDAGTEKRKEKKEKKLKMIKQLQSYNAKYKAVRNAETTAFLLFSFFSNLEKEIKEE